MKTDEIRDRFLRFFEARGHKIYPSDSLVPRNDPTLLFTGAGMNQFKDEFLGKVTGPRRAVTCQKCLRTGDLENVGKTAGHHTFFEMLGNFSFGDYFKKEAIMWAWEFLIQELLLKEKDLWVSVYKDDKEAYDIWKDVVKIPEKKILRLGEKENFWPSNAPSDGPNGPCGPCSEIFYGGEDGVEIWNLVFTQFERKDKGRLDPLPNKNIDTGMGLERIARVLQGKAVNFEIDSFQPIINAIKDIAKHPLTLSPEGRSKGEGANVNAIADHIRAVTFAISDGVLPSNEERGYVIRKLIRKAFWYGRGLGLDEPFLYRIVPVVTKVMERPYPELTQHREDISRVVLEEEKRFRNTIDEGMAKLENMLEASGEKKVLSGEDAFKLYDTYGFPLELTQEVSGLKNVKVDIDGFTRCMDVQKLKSRKTSNIDAKIFDSLTLDEAEAVKRIEVTGFLENKEEVEARVLEIFKIDNGEKAVIFLDKTNFYGEKGGQTGDTGVLIKNGKPAADVINAIDVAGRIKHEVILKDSVLEKGDRVLAKIDLKRRSDIRRNHTATHLLHSALRKVLGTHVKQAGSLVSPDRLRFDFTHFKAVTDEELMRVEEIVNENIRENIQICIEEMPIENAKGKGAIMLFGEKYGDIVRMVSAGDYSKELCGGTHAEWTGEIGVFKIISESSIASGMRRIEAITGESAYRKAKEDSDMIKAIAQELQVKPNDILSQIDKLTARLKELEGILEQYTNNTVKAGADEIIKRSKNIEGVDVIIADIKAVDSNILRKYADLIKSKSRNSVFVLVSDKDNKISMIVGMGDAVKNRNMDAVKILNETGAGFGIKGGGRPDFAQAGSKSGPFIKDILKKAEEVIERSL